MNARQITKIKQDKDGKIIISWVIVRPDGREDEHSMSCSDHPRPGFDAALQALAPTLAQWCDVPTEWCKKLTVMGVSLSYSNGVMGACVTAKRPSSANSPLILNAPHKPSVPYSEGGDESVCLTVEQYDAILAIIAEAEAYLDGDRAQMELPMEAADAETADACAGRHSE